MNLVRDVIEDIRLSRATSEQRELLRDGPDPGKVDAAGNQDGSSRVDPPGELGAGGAREDAHRVDGQVVPVILPEDLDLRRRRFNGVAVAEERKLGCQCNADRNQRRDVQLVVVVLGSMGRERADRLDDEDLQGEGESGRSL